MPNEDLQQYKNLYLKTGREYLVSLQKYVSALMTNHHDEAVIDQAHIDAHSLKGQSLLMQYTNIGLFSEAIERTFSAVKEHKITLNDNILQQIKEGIEKMKESMDEIEKHDKDLDLSVEIKELKKVSGE